MILSSFWSLMVIVVPVTCGNGFRANNTGSDVGGWGLGVIIYGVWREVELGGPATVVIDRIRRRFG